MSTPERGVPEKATEPSILVTKPRGGGNDKARAATPSKRPPEWAADAVGESACSFCAFQRHLEANLEEERSARVAAEAEIERLRERQRLQDEQLRLMGEQLEAFRVLHRFGDSTIKLAAAAADSAAGATAPAATPAAATREAFNGRGNGCAWMEVCLDGADPV